MPADRRTPRPAVSDIAMALATRRSPERSAKVTISDANAKGVVHITVEISDPDPQEAAKASDVYDVLRAKYPRENGTQA